MANNIPLVGGDPSQMYTADQVASLWKAMGNNAATAADKTAQAPHANPISGIAKQAVSKVANGVSDIGTSANTALNNFGSSIGFGSQSGAPLAGGIGPTNAFDTAGTLGTTSSLGSLAGGALSGVGIGGLVSSWVGGNQTGGMIGGGIGGLIGAATGISSGIAMGATLGSIVPGLGTVLGAVAGSLLGGMFGGGGTPHPVSTFKGASLGADGSINNAVYSNKHIGQSVGEGIQNDFSKYMQGQATKYGIQYSDLPIYGGYTDKHGLIGISNDANYWDSWSGHGNVPTADSAKNFTFDPNDTDAKNTAYEDAWKYAVQSSGLNPDTLVAKFPTNASEIHVQRQSGPSDWDNFISNYRTAHPQQE